MCSVAKEKTKAENQAIPPGSLQWGVKRNAPLKTSTWQLRGWVICKAAVGANSISVTPLLYPVSLRVLPLDLRLPSDLTESLLELACLSTFWLSGPSSLKMVVPESRVSVEGTAVNPTLHLANSQQPPSPPLPVKSSGADDEQMGY